MTRGAALTRRQADVLMFVKGFIAEHEYAPTIREICAALNLTSLATVHKHLTALQEKGHIRREFNRERATAVLDRCPVCGKDLAN